MNLSFLKNACIYPLSVWYVQISFFYTFSNVYGGERPSLKLLYKHVVPGAATKWRELGVELLDADSEIVLSTIEENHPKDVEKCCKLMLDKWLKTSVNASWKQLIQALKSPAIKLNHLASDLYQQLSEEESEDVHEGTYIVYGMCSTEYIKLCRAPSIMLE